MGDFPGQARRALGILGSISPHLTVVCSDCTHSKHRSLTMEAAQDYRLGGDSGCVRDSTRFPRLASGSDGGGPTLFARVVVPGATDDTVFEFADIMASHAVNPRTFQPSDKAAAPVVDETVVVEPEGQARLSVEVVSHIPLPAMVEAMPG
jgi:hypothetical protein